MNPKPQRGFILQYLLRPICLLFLLSATVLRPAAAAPIASASGSVFDLTNFQSLATVPVNTGGIATSAAFEQPGGPLSSSFVRSIARLDGFIAAGAQVSANSRVSEEWKGHSQFRDQFVNRSSTPQTYVFDFDIFSMSLRILDQEGVSQSAEIFAQVGVTPAGGVGQALFRIDEKLVGGLTSHTLTDAGTFVPNSTFTCSGGGTGHCSDFQYEFDPFHGQIVLGTFNPGQSFELQYDLEATVSARPIGVNGASASIGDPLDVLGNGVGGSVRTLSAVPEPSSMILLGWGVTMLAAVLFRRRLTIGFPAQLR